MFDYLITGGTVVDGTGRAGYPADVAISGDRVVRIGAVSSQAGPPGRAEIPKPDRAAAPAGWRTEIARQVVDATGCVVAPGFIDVHNHSEAWLLKGPAYSVKTRQGFTTEVLMSDGISYSPLTPAVAPEFIRYWRAVGGLELSDYTGWRSIGDFLGLLAGRIGCNVLPLVPYGNVRVIAKGWDAAAPDAGQADKIARLIGEGMEQGAAGVSTGLDYIAECFASTEELAAACRAAKPSGGLHVTHIRYSLGRLEGLMEAVEIGRRTGVPVHISHLMGRTVQESETLLDYIEKVAVRDVDFTFDSIPYCSASTILLSQLPIDAWLAGPSAALRRMRAPGMRERLAATLAALDLNNYRIAYIPGGRHDHLFGQTLAQCIAERNAPPADAVLGLLEETDLAVLMVYIYGSGDAPAWPFLAHPRGMLGSDGIYWPGGCVHPRVYGSVARMLGSLVRRERLFALEQAVRKMSGLPAERFGLRDRGVLAEGNFADVVVFDPAAVQDRATYERPHQPSEGVEHVWVNGCPVVTAGQPVTFAAGAAPGRRLSYRA